jgi:hypothetical protein
MLEVLGGSELMFVFFMILASCATKQTIAKVDTTDFDAVYVPDGYKGGIVAVPFDYEVFN